MSQKTAGVGNIGEEELAQLEWTAREKHQTGQHLVALFSGMDSTRKAERRMMEGFFEQAKAGQTMAPVLQKVASIAPRTVEFFQKQAQAVPTAYRLFPELAKVATTGPGMVAGSAGTTPRPAPTLGSKPGLSPTRGPTPTAAPVSVGAA